MRNQLLGIDIGTSACKIAVFDDSGKVLAHSNQPYEVYYPHPGWVEQDADEWWNAVVCGIRDVLGKDGVEASAIHAIGIDGQSWSAIPVDKDGKAIANTPIWMDTRARDICQQTKERLGEDTIFEIAGNDFLPSYTAPKIMWFKQNCPEIYKNTDKFLQSNSYIAFKLTGNYSQDKSQLYGLQFFDLHKMQYNEELAKEMGIDISMIPRIYDCDEVVGKVTREAAEITGLIEGIPVVAGGLDAACGTLGAGVYDLGQTQEQGGQSGGMSICIDKALAHKKLILGTHVVPGKYLLQGGTVGGSGSLRWYRQELSRELSFDEITKEAATVPLGADGVIFLPYLAGERSPIWDPDAKGVFYGLGFDKTRAHMARAVLEGAAFALYHNLCTAEEVGAEVESMNAMGGAANSVVWTQIKADITGKTIRVPASDTATTLGAVLLAGVGCGMYGSYKEAVEKTITVTRTQTPDMEKHEQYKKYFELYLDIYENLKGTFHKYRFD